MKRIMFSNLKPSAFLKTFSLNLSLVTAIVGSSVLAVIPSWVYAADTWGYCVVIDNHGHRARFTNIFHYPFSVSKYDLKPSADTFKSDIDSDYKGAADCLVFNDEASAIRQRDMNVSGLNRFGAEAYVMDYNVKYKDYPSTPLPKVAANQAEQSVQHAEEKSLAPASVNEQPVVAVQSGSQEQHAPQNNHSSQPVTQVKQPTRLSTQEAIRQAQEKTKRLNQAKAYNNQTNGQSSKETANQYVGSGRDYRLTGNSGSFLERSSAVDIAQTNVEIHAGDLCGSQFKAEIRWAQPVCTASAHEDNSYKCSIDGLVSCYVNNCSKRFCGTGH